MARLQTIGFEMQQAGSSAGTSEAPGVAFNGTPPFVTGASARTGAAMSCLIAQGRQLVLSGDDQGNAFSTARDYYLRAYFSYNAAPSVAVFILSVQVGGTRFGVKMETSGALSLYDRNGSQVGSSSSVLATGTFYRIEMHLNVPTSGNGTIGFRIDGASVVADTAAAVGTAAPNPFEVGVAGFSGTGMTGIFDDVALNDGTGASQTSYPGSGKIVYLLPISDNARSNMVTGSNGTTSLFDALDNVPPVGVATASKTNTSQDYCVNNGSTFDANMQTYTTGGIGASDTITLVQALLQHGGGDTANGNDYTNGLTGVSNPTLTKVTNTVLNGTLVGTSPSNWKMVRTAPAYSPSVTLGTSPVVRCSKDAVSGSNQHHFDYMALAVEYIPVGGATTITLGAASAAATPTLALTAPTQVALGAASAAATPTLALSATTIVGLNAASATSSATMALSAATQVPLNAASAAATPTLALNAPTQVALGAANSTSSTSLSLAAGAVTIPLNASSAAATPTLALTSPTQVPLGAASALGSSAMAITSPTTIPLNACAGGSSASLAVNTTAAISCSSSATSSATLALRIPIEVTLGAATSTSTATATIRFPARAIRIRPLHTSTRASVVRTGTRA